MVKKSFATIEHSHKENLLIAPHIYKIFKEFGIDYLENFLSESCHEISDIIKNRLNEMYMNSKYMIEGRIPQNSINKIIDFSFPSFISSKLDTYIGFNKLLFGNSHDISIGLIDDFSQEVRSNITGHLEQGFFTDYYLLSFQDEILNKFDKKSKIKIRDVYKKTKNLIKSAQLLINNFRKTRNEYLPQWSNSNFSIFLISYIEFLNLFFEFSNYEIFGNIWDCYNSKTQYKFKDHSFLIYPQIPILKTMLMSGRKTFMKSFGQLTTEKCQCLHLIEDRAIDWIKEEFPEIYSKILLNIWKTLGIPIPRVTLECKINYLELLDENETLNRKYPEGSRITTENLQISEDECFDGYFTNISEQTPLNEKITPENLLSKKFGRRAKLLKSN
ncbi:MAG: hypothetical protein ACTSVY_06650 [Candidatus Helarchaeota archaeon]